MADRLTKRIGDGIQYDNGKYTVTCYPKNNNLTAVDKLAVKLCELEDMNEWHRVEDQLPEEDVRVLVYLNSSRSYTNIETDIFYHGEWARWGKEVTHWMPLPKLPNVKE